MDGGQDGEYQKKTYHYIGVNQVKKFKWVVHLINQTMKGSIYRTQHLEDF